DRRLAENTRTETIKASNAARRPNSFISPPQMSVAPVAKIPMSAMNRATGPVSDCSIFPRGISHGMAPHPTACAVVGMTNHANTKSHSAFRFITKSETSFSCSHMFNDVLPVLVSQDADNFANLPARLETVFLIDEHHHIDRFRNEVLLRCASRFCNETLQ